MENGFTLFRCFYIALCGVRHLPMGAIRCLASRTWIQCELDQAQTQTGQHLPHQKFWSGTKEPRWWSTQSSFVQLDVSVNCEVGTSSSCSSRSLPLCSSSVQIWFTLCWLRLELRFSNAFAQKKCFCASSSMPGRDGHS
jgi:hypothetical protein